MKRIVGAMYSLYMRMLKRIIVTMLMNEKKKMMVEINIEMKNV